MASLPLSRKADLCYGDALIPLLLARSLKLRRRKDNELSWDRRLQSSFAFWDRHRQGQDRAGVANPAADGRLPGVSSYSAIISALFAVSEDALSTSASVSPLLCCTDTKLPTSALQIKSGYERRESSSVGIKE
eukprot:401549-Rhodomonas_salina.2